MTNELVKLQMNDFDIALNGIEQIGKLASMLLKTPHYRKLGEDGIYAILFACKSHGIDPFQGLNGGFNYINGRVGMSTELMAAIIRKKGHSIDMDPKSNDEICILHGTRKDTNDKWTSSFSVEDARKADLLKNMYNKYRSVMLYNRAMSKLARQLFPDVIKGNGYSEDELVEIEDQKNAKPTETINVKPIDSVETNCTRPSIESDKNCNQLNEPTKEFKEKVDELLQLVNLCPPERKSNFYKIIESKGWTHPYDMSEKFLTVQLNAAKDLLNNQKLQNEQKIKENMEIPF